MEKDMNLGEIIADGFGDETMLLYGAEYVEVPSRDMMLEHLKNIEDKRGFRGGLEFDIGIYRVDGGSECNRILAVHLIDKNRCFVAKREIK